MRLAAGGRRPEVRPRLPLSLDWEDWYQLCCPPYDAADAHERYEDRLALATDLALGLCAELGATATWFCLTDQAIRHPELLRRIVSQGHRIGLHGPDHARAFAFGRRAFAARTRDGKARLEDLAGAPVLGFRAPEWSLRGTAEDY
ncbi:MAG TPA: polysaccharide deacetylase family protein, partial [Holophagaceae bacterium]|nr:polysaccharide deacetylase family protein [Holophagaceae bacterium]